MPGWPALAEYPEQAVSLVVPCLSSDSLDKLPRMIARNFPAKSGALAAVVNTPGDGPFRDPSDSAIHAALSSRSEPGLALSCGPVLARLLLVGSFWLATICQRRGGTLLIGPYLTQS